MQIRPSQMLQFITAIAIFAAYPAHSQSLSPVAQRDQPNRIAIEYVPPENPDLQSVHEILRTVRALERIQQILSPLRLPEDLTVKTAECGKADAWYQREQHRPTVTICYELLKSVGENLPEDSDGGIEPGDAKIGQVLWITLHEVGHAAFDIFKVPIFGNEENAADSFATYTVLQFSEARRLIVGAAWAWNNYMKDYQRNPTVQIRLAGLAADHGMPQERVYNLLCLAYGSNPERFADLARDGRLPESRARHCETEYKSVAMAFEKEIAPHIDFALAKRIMDASWLPGRILRSDLQK